VIVADFSSGESIYEKLEQQLEDIPIGILGEYFYQIAAFHANKKLL
jgi:hypothetical protein